LFWFEESRYALRQTDTHRAARGFFDIMSNIAIVKGLMPHS
jgi:hypothetical protein